MEEISRPVVRLDHGDKLSGRALFAADLPTEGMLHGLMLRSERAHARIVQIKLPPLPPGYIVVDHSDVPHNHVQIIRDDTPVFAADTVEYIGDPILMLLGTDKNKVARLLRCIEIIYDDLPAVITPEDATETFFEYHINKGEPDTAFAAADRVIEEEFRTGYQEQVYLETQSLIAWPHDGRISVRGSMQCPYYVHSAVCAALKMEPQQVQIIQDVTGGGFGGKEAYPSILACQVAVAAQKAGQPVRVVFDRREDMEFTSKRHPSLCRYRAAVKDGRVTALKADVRFNAGAYTTLSAVVMQRGLVCANGVYNIPNLHLAGRALKTNTVPNGAFRGFGAPQTFFAIERMMDRIAAELGVDALDFKLAHLVRQDDETSTGGRYHFTVPLPTMIEKTDSACNYRSKRALYAQPQTGRYRRGIGLGLAFHGAGFTGAGERERIKAVVRLRHQADDRVEILVANTDMGQGLKTTLAKIVAHELSLPLTRIIINNPDTDRVPDSGPTVASRSLMIVGELLRRAAARLREQWQDGCEQMMEEHYREPEFVQPFSLERFHGDAYPTYSWSVSAVELELDTLTGQSRLLNVYGCFDIGTPADERIATGQMEGGLLQGVGYAAMEQMNADAHGRIRNNSLSDYLIPTAMDAPKLKIELHVEPYPEGPYGAKGAGELPLVGAAAAYAQAWEQATGRPARHIPLTMEDSLQALEVKA